MNKDIVEYFINSEKRQLSIQLKMEITWENKEINYTAPEDAFVERLRVFRGIRVFSNIA